MENKIVKLKEKMAKLKIEMPFEIEIREALNDKGRVEKTSSLEFEIARRINYVHQGSGYYSCALPDGKHYFDLNPNQYCFFAEVYEKKLCEYQFLKNSILDLEKDEEEME